jgi:hypothetical protein
VNDFEIKFRRALLDVLRSIQQSISTIDKKCNADSNQHEPPAPPDRPTQVQVPPAVADYYEAENRDRPDSTSRDRIRLCVEIVGLAAVIVGGTFAYRTFHEAQRQATAAQAQVDIMQKQLDATIRPWIRISEIRLDTSIPTAPVLSFMPYPAIKPTEGMFIRLVFVIKTSARA